MDEQKVYKTPTNELVKMQVVHLGNILFNLQFVVLAVMLASVLTFIAPAIYYIMLFAVSLFTLGMIYLIYPAFSSWWSGGEKLAKIASHLVGSWKYTVPIILCLAVGAIVCLSLDRYKKHSTKIVISSMIVICALIILILKLINAGVFA